MISTSWAWQRAVRVFLILKAVSRAALFPYQHSFITFETDCSACRARVTVVSLLVEKLHTMEEWIDKRKTRFLVIEFIWQKNALNMGNDNSCMKTYHPRSKTNLHAVCKCENNGIKCIDTTSIITIITCIGGWALSSWHWIIFKLAALTGIHKHILNLFTKRVLSYLSLLRVSSLTNIQWIKIFGRINGVAVLLGAGSKFMT